MDPCHKMQIGSSVWPQRGAESWRVKGWLFPLLLLLRVLGQESVHSNPGDPEHEGSHVQGGMSYNPRSKHQQHKQESTSTSVLSNVAMSLTPQPHRETDKEDVVVNRYDKNDQLVFPDLNRKKRTLDSIVFECPVER